MRVRALGSSEVRRRSNATSAESTAGGGLKQVGGTLRMYRGLRIEQEVSGEAQVRDSLLAWCSDGADEQGNRGRSNGGKPGQERSNEGWKVAVGLGAHTL